MKKGVNFSIRLGKEEWDSQRGAWRCSALQIPGASLTALFREGERLDPRRYQVDVDRALVEWSSGDPPASLLAEIRLTKGVVSADRSAMITAITAVATALIAAITTVYVDGAGSDKQALIQESPRDSASVCVWLADLRIHRMIDRLLNRPVGQSYQLDVQFVTEARTLIAAAPEADLSPSLLSLRSDTRGIQPEGIEVLVDDLRAGLVELRTYSQVVCQNA